MKSTTHEEQKNKRETRCLDAFNLNVWMFVCLETRGKQDTVSWNAMIASCAKHGHGQEALQLSSQMYRLNVKLDHF